MSDGQSEVHGMGAPALWGFTPAIDLLDDIYVHGEESRPLFYDTKGPSGSKATEDTTEKRSNSCEDILLINNGDIRHVLKTAAHLRRWRKFNSRINSGSELNIPAVRFFVAEPALEVLARALLQWAIVIDESIPMQTRVDYFLELHGNTLLRAKTAEYLRMSIIPRLLELFIKDNSPLSPWVDLSLLKSKERDEIENHIRYWLAPKPPLQMVALRESRLRTYFGSRYDSRANLYDWDQTMLLHATMTGIHRANYRRFRETGICYETREAVCIEPNPTLATQREAMERSKGRIMLRGFWSDILVSPFIAFGSESVERDHFELRQNQHVRSIAVVSEAELLAMIAGIEHGRYFCLPDALRKGGDERAKERRSAEDTSSESEQKKESYSLTNENDPQEEGKMFIGPKNRNAEGIADITSTSESNRQPNLEQISVSAHYPPTTPRVPMKLVLLPPDGPSRLSAKQAYQGKFRRAYLGYTAAVTYSDTINSLFESNGQNDKVYLTVDTLKYVPLKEEQKAAFVTSIERKMNEAGWTLESATRTFSSPKQYSSHPTHVAFAKWDESEDRAVVQRRITTGTQKVQSFGDAQVLDGPVSVVTQEGSTNDDKMKRELQLCGTVKMDDVPFSIPGTVYSSGAKYTRDNLLDGLYDLRSNLTFTYDTAAAAKALLQLPTNPSPSESSKKLNASSMLDTTPVVETVNRMNSVVSDSKPKRALSALEEQRRKIIELRTQKLKAKERLLAKESDPEQSEQTEQTEHKEDEENIIPEEQPKE